MKNNKHDELVFWQKAIRAVRAMTEDANRDDESADLMNLESSLKSYERYSHRIEKIQK